MVSEAEAALAVASEVESEAESGAESEVESEVVMVVVAEEYPPATAHQANPVHTKLLLKYLCNYGGSFRPLHHSSFPTIQVTQNVDFDRSVVDRLLTVDISVLHRDYIT